MSKDSFLLTKFRRKDIQNTCSCVYNRLFKKRKTHFSLKGVLEKMIISIDYREKFLEFAHQFGREVQDFYLLSNINEELLNLQHQNLLDIKNFPIDFINEVNRKLIYMPGDWAVYEEVEISSALFLERLHTLVSLYESHGWKEEIKFLNDIAQKVADFNTLVVTKKPGLFSGDGEEILDPNFLKILIVKRTLSGFVMFREIPRDRILRDFQFGS